MKIWIGLSMDGVRRYVPPSVLNAVPTKDDYDQVDLNHRLRTLFADFVGEPIFGYLRIRVTDDRWEQNGKVITLMRSEIAVIRYIEPEDAILPSVNQSVSEPSAAMPSTRAALLEFERSMEKKEGETP